MTIELLSAENIDVLEPVTSTYDEVFIIKFEVDRLPPPANLTTVSVTVLLGDRDGNNELVQKGTLSVRVEGAKAKSFLQRNDIGINLEAEILNALVNEGYIPAGTVVDDF